MLTWKVPLRIEWVQTMKLKDLFVGEINTRLKGTITAFCHQKIKSVNMKGLFVGEINIKCKGTTADQVNTRWKLKCEKVKVKA